MQPQFNARSTNIVEYVQSCGASCNRVETTSWGWMSIADGKLERGPAFAPLTSVLNVQGQTASTIIVSRNPET